TKTNMPKFIAASPVLQFRGRSLCHSSARDGQCVFPTLPPEVVPLKRRNAMRKLIAVAVAAGLSLAFAAPGIAADKTPTTKAACEKAHMKWDASSKTCSKM